MLTIWGVVSKYSDLGDGGLTGWGVSMVGITKGSDERGAGALPGRVDGGGVSMAGVEFLWL